MRGQYDGYRHVAGVAPDSNVETYVALRLEIDNWRWSGVPFFLRSGKSLPLRQTEVRLVFKTPPSLGFSESDDDLEPNQIVLLIDPRPGARFKLHAKRSDGPGLRPIDLDVDFASDGERIPAPYEVLLHAAMQGDQNDFTREDSVEETWRILDPLLGETTRPEPYAPGSWGPAAAEHLIQDSAGGTSRGSFPTPLDNRPGNRLESPGARWSTHAVRVEFYRDDEAKVAGWDALRGKRTRVPGSTDGAGPRCHLP